MRLGRHLRRLCTALFAVCVASVALAGPLDARLTFSLDGGKSWSADFPTVASGAVIKVRAAYTIVDSWENRDVITASIQSSKPFASHTKRMLTGGWMQRHPVYWKSSRSNGDYVWDLDTGGLPKGTAMFMLEIGYWRKGGMGIKVQHISDSQPFYLKLI